MKDTSRAVNALVYKAMMAKSGAERMEMGCSMFESAREMILASLPEVINEAEKRKLLFERTYGEPLPEACLAI